MVKIIIIEYKAMWGWTDVRFRRNHDADKCQGILSDREN